VSDARCRACGSEKQAAYRYVAKGEDIRRPRDEFMRRTCMRCGYEWHEPCLFQEQTEEPQ
jgi:hypothetical protein